MKEFMGKDFLLETQTAKHLYHDIAKDLPIIDYHCHIPPKEVFENRKFDNIAQVWLGGHSVENGKDIYFGDHYKWRLMRASGVKEEYITGDKSDYERFEQFAKSLETAIGNPIVHWTQLELKQFFDCDIPLNSKTCKQIWDLCNEKLQNDPNLSVLGMIRASNVEMVGTTDDPLDDLCWHKAIANDDSIEVKVLPSFRPDRFFKVENKAFVEDLKRLEDITKVVIKNFDDLVEALKQRVTYFVEHGCKASDHGLSYVPSVTINHAIANRTLHKVLNHQNVTTFEIDTYTMTLLYELGKIYAKNDVVMQLHVNAMRNTNTKYFEKLGADTGFDNINNHVNGQGVQILLDALTYEDACPKVILYSLNSAEMELFASLAGSFQADGKVASQIQLGSAWWFLDTKDGMENQLKTLARIGTLGNFVGMLTDSRSFLSYTRHEYFRRILCNLIGHWVENGEFVNDEEILAKIIRNICYENAKKYFSL